MLLRATCLKQCGLSSLCATATGFVVDRTLEPMASGRDVVETVIYRIQRSRVFPDDRDFLRRVAYTESKFGEEPATYREGYNGGIWQFDRFKTTQFDAQSNGTTPELRSIHTAIRDTLGINWMQAKEEDMLKPLYSALAASIYIELTRLTRGPIPDVIKAQDMFWKDYYNTNGGKYGDFERRAQELLEKDMRASGGKIDVMMVVDGSASIGQHAFQTALDSMARLVTLFDLEEANVGMVTYSNTVTSLIPLVNNFTTARLQEAIRGTLYPDAGTNTYLGMMAAVDEFKKLPENRGERGVPRLLVVLTDGNHLTGPKPGIAAQKAAKAGIIPCAFGIGNDIDDSELLEIANNISDYKFRTESYYSLQQQIVLIARWVKTLPQTLKMGFETSETLKEANEKRHYRLEVPENGTTIRLVNERGESRGYWTYADERPSSALYDGTIYGGETFIPPPQPAPGNRSDTVKTASMSDLKIAIESFEANSRLRMWILEGDATESAAVKLDFACFVHVAVYIFAAVLLK
ncbi:unnamed protein product [Bemisia tabaci]|uniref:VWFA domain-containing protein n=2 Tax=Bemisia tabaci TaxID=7038 RepID=A0A9P0G076_BEMTA|nr:unnamed protein product [Bemisia tabaci]